MKKKYKIRDYNFKLILLLISLSIIGILAVSSANPESREKQILGVCFGLFLMFVLSFFDYSFFLHFYWVLYIINILLLLSVEFMGVNVNGATRWVTIAGIQFQPSETSKILLILFYAQFIMKYREKLNTVRMIGTLLLLMLPTLILIYRQPNLSTTIVLAVIFCSIVFVGGLSRKVVISILSFAVPTILIVFYLVIQPNQQLIKPYQQIRILAWLHPEDYSTTEAYQQLNSIIAIGSGGLWGKGLNNNIISSVKNGNFISEPETDFIFAVIGEELGFMGSTLVIVLSCLITIECILAAKKAKDLAGTIICSGVATIIGFQSFMNIAVAVGVMPNTGITLPFVSAGLTSLVSLYIGMGFVLNVRLQAVKTKLKNTY